MLTTLRTITGQILTMEYINMAYVKNALSDGDIDTKLLVYFDINFGDESGGN